MDISTAVHLDGLEQIKTAGVYRVAGKFTLMCHAFNDARGMYVLAYDNDHRFLGVASQQRHNGITGNWEWVSATGDGTSSEHTRGPWYQLRMVDGHLLPPIDKPLWTPAPAAPGMLDGLEQIQGPGHYFIAGKFFGTCSEEVHGYLSVTVLNNEYQILGKACKQDALWAWHPAMDDGSGGLRLAGPREDLIKINGHLLPPIDRPTWTRELADMSPMMVTSRERAAIMMLRGQSTQIPVLEPAIPETRS